MKNRKIVSILMASAMAMVAVGCGSSSSTSTSDTAASAAETTAVAATEAETTAAVQDATESAEDSTTEADAAAGDSAEIGEPFADTVSITILNSKPEITDALQEAADAFGEEYNVTTEIAESSSPADDLQTRYASGDAPTISIVDIANIKDYADKIVDLSDQPWADVGGTEQGVTVDGKLVGMPLTMEAKALLVNKTAIENITGETFDPENYKTLDDFTALCEQLRDGGMEDPVVINQEDWSIGSHFVQYFYALQDGTVEGGEKFIQDVKDGTTTFEDNDVYNACMDAFDVFMEYNFNKDDPLAADYDLNASYVAEGDAAFWVNGTWAWPDFEPYVVDGTEYTIMPLPTNLTNDTNDKLFANATKYAMLDATEASDDQLTAAKMFLNWLVFTDEGQDYLINKCGMVTAFNNITLEPSNPFNVALKQYVDNGQTVEIVSYLPSDHRSELGANMQAYLDGKETREEVAQAFDEYWADHDINY